MKTPHEALAEEIYSIAEPFHHWRICPSESELLETITKHFPPPSEDGIEEIAERFTAWRHAHMDTKEAIKQAILADRQAWETAARADCYLH